MNPDQCLQVGADDEVVAKPGVRVAEVRIVPQQHQPIASSHTIKLESRDLALGWKTARFQMLENLPHEKVRIEMLLTDFEPALTPDSKDPDQLCKLRAGIGQVIRKAPSGRVWPSHDNARPFETFQPLAKDTRRDAMQALKDLAEVIVPSTYLAQDQRCPAFGEYL